MSESVANCSAATKQQQVSLWPVVWAELKPFPGRDLATLRMAIACTAIVLLSNTFRLPFQDVLPFFALFTAKEEKITTAITAVLTLLAITVSVGAAILVFKCTGNRPEFRIPGMAVEIFVGMYLFRILSIGPVGFILAFIVSVLQSIVDLFPTPEEAVHQFLWVWVAVALGSGCAWLATFTLFPVPANRMLQREFVSGWRTVSIALKQLNSGSPAACQRLLRTLTKAGPIRLLKLLKLSSRETHRLRQKRKELTRSIVALDKIAKLTFSYSGRLLNSGGALSISSSEKAILGRAAEAAEYFEREFADGFVPSGNGGTSASSVEPARLQPSRSTGTLQVTSAALPLAEVDSTLEDLVAPPEEDRETKPTPRAKASLFVADAFTNPRHAQFALKVTLAGMIGYFFYTASDYFGIHTVFYTPLIIALGSTGATMHKGVLRVAGCLIGGALGMICTIWVIPRFETLGMYLLIVFCVHALAAWVAFGSERISYMGLQIALAFDLGVLTDYGPSTQIDPIRDRFIGIVLGILIISTVFSLVWPEDASSIARQKLAASLRAIASLLNIRGGKESNSEREGFELEIASHLAEANAYQENAAFEALIHGPPASEGPDLETTTAIVEKVYVTSLPWIRQQAATMPDLETADRGPDMIKPMVDAVEASAAMMEGVSGPNVAQDALTVDDSPRERDPIVDAGRGFGHFEQLLAAVRELQIVGFGGIKSAEPDGSAAGHPQPTGWRATQFVGSSKA
jgi:multidrug resistance protein MdtO